MTARALIGSLLALVLGAATAAPVRAEFGPIELISKNAAEQADSASEPALSGNGRFVAFRAEIGRLSGVFRKDLVTGDLSPVAAGDRYQDGSPATDAAAPSISADGRYVSFTTSSSLVPASDDPEGELPTRDGDVYVADLATSPPSYEQASARDGCDPDDPEAAVACGLAYASNSGSGAAAAVALSADGRRVAFATRADSNLTTADPAEIETPLGQVVVRDLEADESILISVRRDALVGPTADPVEGGAVYRPTSARPPVALSADGTTVAWLGEHIPDQAPMLADEEDEVRNIERIEAYNEPLWRRVPVPGLAPPPTRRVVGGGDPLAPGCPQDGTLGLPACQGPYPGLTEPRSADGAVAVGWLDTGTMSPRLSADGQTVAVIGNPDTFHDAFVVSMQPGLSRNQAVRRLTRWTNPDPRLTLTELQNEPQFEPFVSPLNEIAISPDGRRIAFSTIRQHFPLAPPILISAQPAGLGGSELYQLDLVGETLERATPGRAQDVSLGIGVQGAASYSADGRFLAFASDASNLVPADANGASDVFVVETLPAGPARPSTISPAPPSLVLRPRWRLTVGAFSRRDGSVRVVAVVPGAGALRARARAQLGRKLRMRRVAAGRRRARRDGVLRLDLKLRKPLRRLAHRKGGLDATVRVAFRARGRKPLRDELDVSFRVRPGKKGRRR